MFTPNSPITYFVYARKSTESEDRQVASIDSQIKELQAIAERENLRVCDVLSESQSAQAPGRPMFNNMLARLHRGEGSGILCWKLDRLARNPVDGGNISWMLQQGHIRHIRTHDRSYYPTDNVLMMSVEFGMANQFLRDLSQNVKRGLQAKVERGWFPGVAKAGYLNDAVSGQGEKTTPRDPVRFPLLKRAFSFLLTGVYTPMQVLDKLNNEWGYRTLKRKKMGGRPLGRSTFYDILNDPFYYGHFEFPAGSGKWYRGSHEPMITEEEFWRIQKLLGKDGRPRPQERAFAFTGLIACGECGAAITAEMKDHVVCSKCNHKFSSTNRTLCPSCGTAIAVMQRPRERHYEYYHCTKRKVATCPQKAVEVKELEIQVKELLDTLTVSERLKDWFLRQIGTQAEQDRRDRAPILQSLQKAHADCQKRLDNLLKLKISPQNSTGELLSDQEFAIQKSTLTMEMHRLKQKMADVENHADHWLEGCTKTFNFACYAKAHFQNGPSEVKRTILSALGSNLTLFDKKLRISLHNHFVLMQRVHERLQAQNSRFEPVIFGSTNTQSAPFKSGLCAFLGLKDDVRTFFLQLTTDYIYIPDLKPCS